jgi:pimeloyl-ACP methyl ester carboxylesterase
MRRTEQVWRRARAGDDAAKPATRHRRVAARRAASAGLATVGLLAMAACLPVGTYADGQQANATNPSAPPPGANNFACRPTPAHPYPVILLPGTSESAAEEFQALSPMLFNAGYCVFALDYGQIGGSGPYAVGDIPTSAGQLATFVDQVLDATHAHQVDIVGHSQGGMMPRWYIKFLGGAPKVHMLVGLAPSNHGTSTASPQDLQALGLTAPAWGEQWTNSTFMAQLNAGRGRAALHVGVPERTGRHRRHHHPGSVPDRSGGAPGHPLRPGSPHRRDERPGAGAELPPACLHRLRAQPVVDSKVIGREAAPPGAAFRRVRSPRAR